MRYPDYDHSIVSVTNSVLRAFGAQCRHTSLPLLDTILAHGYRNVVLMLFDGMGTEALETHLPENSFLRRHVVDTLSSVFPSTTSAALPSIESGLTPYEHGWLGWSLYFRELDQIVDLFPNTLKDSRGVPAAEFHAARTFLPLETIAPAIAQAGLGRMITISPYDGIRVSTQDALFDAVRNTCGEPGRKYIYAYWNQPDAIMHKTGCRSEQTRESIQAINKSVQDLCELLSDTLVMVIADHGHIDVRYHVITDSPEIHSMLKRPISVENRAAAFYIKDECKRQFPEVFKQAYGDEFLLLSQDEVLSSGLFGSGNQNARFLESIGDFLAIAISDTALAYSQESKQHVSTHAGLTDAEMRVPLILIEKPAI